MPVHGKPIGRTAHSDVCFHLFAGLWRCPLQHNQLKPGLGQQTRFCEKRCQVAQLFSLTAVIHKFNETYVRIVDALYRCLVIACHLYLKIVARPLSERI